MLDPLQLVAQQLGLEVAEREKERQRFLQRRRDEAAKAQRAAQQPAAHPAVQLIQMFAEWAKAHNFPFNAYAKDLSGELTPVGWHLTKIYGSIDHTIYGEHYRTQTYLQAELDVYPDGTYSTAPAESLFHIQNVEVLVARAIAVYSLNKHTPFP